MLGKPIRAKDIQVKIFYSGECTECGDTLESAVNQWLGNLSDNTAVHDILYQHCLAPASGLDVASLAVIYGKTDTGNPGVATL